MYNVHAFSLFVDVPLSTEDEDEEEKDDMNTRERASLPIGYV